VAEKVRAGQQTWFVLSSVLTTASADGKTNSLVTHDVVAETSLSKAALVVTSHLQPAELRGMPGLSPKYAYSDESIRLVGPDDRLTLQR
jgi:hypothetical protein